MKAVIISNGIIEDYKAARENISDSDLVVCADGGAIHALKMDIVPKVIIGDFDSVDQGIIDTFKQKGAEIISFPVEKDKTDTQLAVEYAVENGAKEVCFLGGVGTRFDHTFANVSQLIWLMKRGIRGVIKNYHNEIHVIDRYIILEGKVGEKISLLPITPTITGIHTRGLKYALEDGTLYYDQTKGISNETISESIEIVIRDGMLLVIKAKD